MNIHTQSASGALTDYKKNRGYSLVHCGFAATTKTAAVTNRAWRAIEASLSALTLRLCLKWCGHLRFTLTGFVTCRRHETALRAVTKAHGKNFETESVRQPKNFYFRIRPEVYQKSKFHACDPSVIQQLPLMLVIERLKLFVFFRDGEAVLCPVRRRDPIG